VKTGSKLEMPFQEGFGLTKDFEYLFLGKFQWSPCGL
jgi:hypothetical protein